MVLWSIKNGEKRWFSITVSDLDMERRTQSVEFHLPSICCLGLVDFPAGRVITDIDKNILYKHGTIGASDSYGKVKVTVKGQISSGPVLL